MGTRNEYLLIEASTHTHTHTHTRTHVHTHSRDSQGRSNGYFVLGYRIYVNGRSHKSVDGSMVFEALLQHPVQATAPYHKLKVHVRYLIHTMGRNLYSVS